MPASSTFPMIDFQRARLQRAIAAFPVEEQQRISAALAFAEQSHAGQERKGSAGTPYIIHPIRIACALIEEFGVRDADVVAAGLLHDVVEDCGVVQDAIAAQFGSRVGTFVRWLTWERGQDAKWRSAQRMRRAPRGVRLVKAADIFDNAHDYATAVMQRRMVLRGRYGYDRWGRTVIATLGPDFVARLDVAIATLDTVLRTTAAALPEKANRGKQMAIDVGAGRRGFSPLPSCLGSESLWLERRWRSRGGGAGKPATPVVDTNAVGTPSHSPSVRGGEQNTVHRYPLRTPLITPTTNLLAMIREIAVPYLLPGDLLAISERIVAITQGRAYRLEDIHPSRVAKFLVRFVHKSPYGIGLGSPWTMELAIREAGLPRIVLGCIVAAVTKPFGLRGMFYRVVGKNVNAIDGPCDYTLAPFGKYAKLGPKDPERVAESLARELGVSIAIIDANDLGVTVLGTSDDIDSAFIRAAFRDNPLGQTDEQTPMAIVRSVPSDPRPSISDFRY